MTNTFKSEQDIINMIPDEWKELCDKDIFKEFYWKNICSVLNANKFYPKHNDIFKAFELIKPQDVKVVIIGQDPYIKEDQAIGLSFAVKNGLTIPPSLRNIYKEIIKEYKPSFTEEQVNKLLTKYSKKGDISKLCEQGILLLNSVLTVEPGKSNSHKNIGWENFTSHVIKKLDEKYKIVFMAWGNNALQILENNVKYNQIIKAGHPSPLNYSNPFVGCNCFKNCNIVLKNKYNIEPINWLCVFT